MSLYHPKRYKVSFAERPNDTDISSNRLAAGAAHVHLHPRIDDKSSWTKPVFAGGQYPPCLAAALPRTQELSKWTDRELHDIGRSWSDVAYEAEKPFWRA